MWITSNWHTDVNSPDMTLRKLSSPTESVATTVPSFIWLKQTFYIKNKFIAFKICIIFLRVYLKFIYFRIAENTGEWDLVVNSTRWQPIKFCFTNPVTSMLTCSAPTCTSLATGSIKPSQLPSRCISKSMKFFSEYIPSFVGFFKFSFINDENSIKNISKLNTNHIFY